MSKQRTWVAVYERLEDERRQRGWTKTDLYDRSVSEATYMGMRHGRPIKRDDKRAELARAFGWSPDSIDRLLAGDDPIEVDQPTPAPTDDIAEVLVLARSMREGLEKSQSRDDKLSDIINLCEKISATQSALVCRVLENAARIEALLEHFDLEVDLEPSPSV